VDRRICEAQGPMADGGFTRDSAREIAKNRISDETRKLRTAFWPGMCGFGAARQRPVATPRDELLPIVTLVCTTCLARLQHPQSSSNEKPVTLYPGLGT